MDDDGLGPLTHFDRLGLKKKAGHYQSGSDLMADMAAEMVAEKEEPMILMDEITKNPDDSSSDFDGDIHGDGRYRDDGDLNPNVGNTVRHLARHRMMDGVVGDDGDEMMEEHYDNDGFRAKKGWYKPLLNNPNITGMQSRDAMLRRKEEQKELYRRHQQMTMEEVYCVYLQVVP